MAKEWAVVKHAGFTNERVVSICFSYDDAYCCVKEQYTPEEEEELDVAIVKWDDETQDWTMEY